MRGDPKSLGDRELARIYAATPLERRLESAGCLGTLAALLLFLLAVFASIFKIAFIVAALAAATAFWARHLLGLPKRAYREELNWRRGNAPLAQYMAEARGELARDGADWMILFSQRSLPHGPLVWLQIVLTQGPPAQAQARLRVSRWALPEWQDGEGTRDLRVEAALPGTSVQELLLMLKEVDLATLTDVPSAVIDGAPCRLALLRLGAEGVGRCNLGGLTNDRRQLPTVAFCL